MTENVAVREFVTKLINAWNAGIREGDLVRWSIRRENAESVIKIMKGLGIAVYLEELELNPKIRNYEDVNLPKTKVTFKMAEITEKTILNPFE